MTPNHNIEFFADPRGNVHVCQDGQINEITLTNYAALIDRVHDKIAEDYPECDARLDEHFSHLAVNPQRMRFRKVERFIRCNMSTFDNTPDVTTTGHFNLETVTCARRGDCKDEGVICQPKPASNLTAAQTKVLQLYATRLTVPEIAAKLCIEPTTVERHFKNAMVSTGTHNRAELILHAIDRRIVQ